MESAVRTAIFILGMVLLELSCLLPTSDLYQGDGFIDEKALKKRIEGIKVTSSPQLANLIQSLLVLDESKRTTLDQIYKNPELVKPRKVEYFQNRAGVWDFKTFEGIVIDDRKWGVGEGLSP